ncbi:hypothetical protein HMI55_004969 [Coelomomyces lativittatus]|nr:hypothetical protein HMI55_004969 [Coelomomyces lativittatus]
MANGNLPAHAMAAEQMARQQYASIMNKKGSEKTATPTIEPEEELEMDLPPGIEEKDVELVMNQADLNRAQAIKAIIKNNGDVVNAIMDVTSS